MVIVMQVVLHRLNAETTVAAAAARHSRSHDCALGGGRALSRGAAGVQLALAVSGMWYWPQCTPYLAHSHLLNTSLRLVKGGGGFRNRQSASTACGPRPAHNINWTCVGECWTSETHAYP
jgi:hypothetical protein